MIVNSNIVGDSINLEKHLSIQVNDIPSLINNNIEAFISNKTKFFLKIQHKL